MGLFRKKNNQFIQPSWKVPKGSWFQRHMVLTHVSLVGGALLILYSGFIYDIFFASRYGPRTVLTSHISHRAFYPDKEKVAPEKSS
ncbi:hypothetical protein CHUAL_009304 [Chamberlinius hualienensis]